MANKYLLVIASSGRMLAQAARNAGFLPLVIDLFADTDTQDLAIAVHPIATLSSTDLTPALDILLQRYPVSDAIYGSGFEYFPDSLRYLENKLHLLGNNATTFGAASDKTGFFSVLKNHGIPFPDISLTPPENSGDWLFKPLHGQGGLGIRSYQARSLIDEKGYWQRYLTGSAHSVLFLADGQRARIAGFNTQWTENPGDSEFLFAGIINHCPLTDKHRQQLTRYVDLLTSHWHLKGLNSLDFMLADKKLYVLEINARPPASMPLYDNLLTAHINACLGILPDTLPTQRSFQAYQIIYAPSDLRIPDNFLWPSCCMDKPPAGAWIRPGQPICSMIAHGFNSEQVLAQCRQIKQTLIQQLQRY